MKKPKYGWFDLFGRTWAGACLVIATADAVVGLHLWSTALIACALGALGCCKVDRLRQDIRVTYHAKGEATLTADQFRRMEQISRL